jgi:hypothetical protein
MVICCIFFLNYWELAELMDNEIEKERKKSEAKEKKIKKER